MRGKRADAVAAFAPRRALAFAVLALASVATAFASPACSSPEAAQVSSSDAAPSPPPGPCVVAQTAAAACEPGPPLPVDAGTSDANASDANASDDAASDDAAAPDGGEPPDAADPLAPPESESRCLVTADVTLACPSAVGSAALTYGKEGASEVLIAQRGLAYQADPAVASVTNDDHAYVQLVHLDGRGGASFTVDPVPPYVAGTTSTSRVGLLPGSAAREAALVTFSASPNGGTSLRAGVLRPGAPPVLGAPFDVPRTSSGNLFASRSGEGFLTVKPEDGTNAPLVLVRGLPDAPRSVTTAIPGAELLLAVTDPAGSPAGLFRAPGTSTVRLLEGDAFTTERWSGTSDDGGFFDLVYVEEPSGAVPVVLLGSGGEITARFIRSADPSAPYAVLGRSFSSCPRSTYVGVTCDACPVTSQCETGEDDVHEARLFTSGGRVFAVYYATDVRRRMEYVLDQTPVIGVGCVCSLVAREQHELADSLVVVEITKPADSTSAPEVVERMRLPLYAARTTGSVILSPRSDGDVDVMLGNTFAGYDSFLTQYPDAPTPVRVMRLSTKSIP